mgnify:CR=1 FL=1
MNGMLDQMDVVLKQFGNKKGTTNDRNNTLLKMLSSMKQTVPKSIADVTGLSKAFEGLEKAIAKGSDPKVIENNMAKIRKAIDDGLIIKGENADSVLREMLGDNYSKFELNVSLR